jgi:hypothetical protein
VTASDSRDITGRTRASGLAAIAVALPTVIWRVLVGLGATLGTPASWRRSEHLPGAGTSYVFGLSALQLAAALLTLVLVVPGADRLPRWSPVAAGRRMPRELVAGVSLIGSFALISVCVLSVINWRSVDPFHDAPTVSGWSLLCWACYAAALAWPVLLIATTLGYWRSRSRHPAA